MMESYYLVKKSQLRSDASFVPREHFTATAHMMHQGNRLTIAGACRGLVLCELDQRAICEMGIDKESYWLSEYKMLEDKITELEAALMLAQQRKERTYD